MQRILPGRTTQSLTRWGSSRHADAPPAPPPLLHMPSASTGLTTSHCPAVLQGQKLMMMGSADVLAAPPPTATIFAEDLPQEAIDAAATNPAGLANLGNTCYLNSSLQCLRAIPEVSTSLQKFVGGSGAAVSPANTEGNAWQHGQTPPLAVPELGSCDSAGRAWRLWAARHSQGKRLRHWASSHCLRALGPAASTLADATALGPAGLRRWYAGAQRRARPLQLRQGGEAVQVRQPLPHRLPHVRSAERAG